MDAATILRHIVGTWSLQSYTSTSVNDPSDISTPWGTAPEGVIIYTSDGYVSLHILNPGQPPYADSDFFGGTDAECAESARKYSGYCGPFEVVEEDGGKKMVLLHRTDLSFYPNWTGQTQRRVVKLDLGEGGKGDVLTLSGDGPIYTGGAYRELKLVWKRKVDEKL